jgi:hypothetical protein
VDIQAKHPPKVAKGMINISAIIKSQGKPSRELGATNPHFGQGVDPANFESPQLGHRFVLLVPPRVIFHSSKWLQRY